MINPRYCRKCGTNLPLDSQFCPSCGTSQHTTGYAPTSTPPQPSYEQPGMGTGRLPAGRMLHNRYRLLEKIGQGGMGAVYVAQDTQLGDRLVAVKEMSMSRLAPQEIPPAVEQFKREAHLLAGLHHINLPVIYDHFGEENRWYLVMSFVQGGTLQAYLESAPGKKLPVNEVVRIGIDLCNVLDYLHSHQPQIIFRDLKPLNIMITPQGQIYLIDFGIARHFKQDQNKDTAYYYSAGYAPPEQYGQSQTGPRSDIYSLGATLHQMLSGHNPASKPFHFPALQLLDPTIPVPLAKLIAQMLEMNEQQRPPSMAAVREELEKIRNPAPIPPTSQVDYAAKRPVQAEPNKATNVASPEAPGTQDKKSAAPPDKGQKPIAAPRAISGRASRWWLAFSVAMLIAGLWSAFVPTSVFLRLPFISLFLATLLGLVFFFGKGRTIIDLLGGIALAILGDTLLLLTHQRYESLSFYFYYNDLMYLLSLSFNNAVINIGSTLLLLLGTYCFTRRASRPQKMIFGIGLALLGAFQVLLWWEWPRWDLFGLVSFVPLIALWLWIGQIALGVAILVRARHAKSESAFGQATRA